MAVKIYHYNSNTQISPHFKSNEFASYSGTYNKLYSKDIKIDTELIKKLEMFFNYGITSIEIESGYRTPTHSTDVGGSTKDTHTLGLAADIYCKVNGINVPSKYVACYAELIGFSGIGVMKNTCHVDVRTIDNYRGNGHWFGDERDGRDNALGIDNKPTGISSFFTYFGLTEDEVKYKYIDNIVIPSEQSIPNIINITQTSPTTVTIKSSNIDINGISNIRCYYRWDSLEVKDNYYHGYIDSGANINSSTTFDIIKPREVQSIVAILYTTRDNNLYISEKSISNLTPSYPCIRICDNYNLKETIPYINYGGVLHKIVPIIKYNDTLYKIYNTDAEKI